MATTRKRSRRWDGGGQSGPQMVSAGKAPGEARIGQALRGRVQAKLAVSQPGDASEREADRTAVAVMRGGDAQGLHPRPALIQRACATCAEEDDVVSRK